MQAQLADMATDPDDKHMITLSSFALFAEQVNAIGSTVCNTPSVKETGAPLTDKVDGCEARTLRQDPRAW